MAAIQQDMTIEGDVTCNNCTVRGNLTVGGIPLQLGVNVEANNVPIAGNPHQILNFTGPVTVADAGGGQANIGITGIAFQNAGVPIAGAPHTVLNTGTGLTMTNAGGGVALIAGGVTILDEGIAIVGNPKSSINFVGAVVAADAGGATCTVTVPGITFQDDGVPVAGAPHTTLNAGTGLVVTDAGGGVALIEGGMDIQDNGVPIAGNPKDTINYAGNGVVTTDAPPDTAVVTIPRNAIVTWGAGDIDAAADSRFLSPGFIATAPLTDTFQFAVPFVGNTSLRCLHVRHNLANGDGDAVQYTVFVNGVATAITVSLVTGAVGQAADLVNAVTVVQGDRVSIQATKALDITSGVLSVQASLVFD